ncbi:hypothetical protein D0Y65_053824, partial [Glycine soja]
HRWRRKKLHPPRLSFSQSLFTRVWFTSRWILVTELALHVRCTRGKTETSDSEEFLSPVDALFSPAWASEEKGQQWIYVVWVYSGSDWGSVEALHCLCFRFFLPDSLSVLLLLYATLHPEPQYCEPICFNAIETKKDLLWSGVFRRLSHTKIFLSLHILKRGFHLIP